MLPEPDSDVTQKENDGLAVKARSPALAGDPDAVQQAYCIESKWGCLRRARVGSHSEISLRITSSCSQTKGRTTFLNRSRKKFAELLHPFVT